MFPGRSLLVAWSPKAANESHPKDYPDSHEDDKKDDEELNRAEMRHDVTSIVILPGFGVIKRKRLIV